MAVGPDLRWKILKTIRNLIKVFRIHGHDPFNQDEG